jgi:hypothetical protein
VIFLMTPGESPKHWLGPPIKEQKPKADFKQLDSCPRCDLWECQSCWQQASWSHRELSMQIIAKDNSQRRNWKRLQRQRVMHFPMLWLQKHDWGQKPGF